MYGDTSLGKSTAIENIVMKDNESFVFYPGVGPFFLHGLRNESHKIIVFEDFNPNVYFREIDILKRLMEGRKFKVNEKFGVGHVLEWKGVVIFVSNYLPFTDEAFLSRVLLLKAEVPYFEENVKEKNISETSTEEMASSRENVLSLPTSICGSL